MRLLLIALLAAAPCLAPGAARAADAETAAGAALEAVTAATVEGLVEVDAQGVVTAFTAETPLPAPMGANLEARVRQWKFAPVVVDGVAVPAKGRLSVSLSARKQGDGFVVQVDHASVRDIETAAGPVKTAVGRVVTRDATPPKYPASILRQAVVPARILVAVLVDADGKVADVALAQSTLLDADEHTRHAPRILGEFERAALKSAREWRFDVVPGTTPATPEEMTIYVPVGFGGHQSAAGAWRPQLRRPRAAPPWLAGSGPASVGDDPSRTHPGSRQPLELLDAVTGATL